MADEIVRQIIITLSKLGRGGGYDVEETFFDEGISNPEKTCHFGVYTDNKSALRKYGSALEEALRLVGDTSEHGRQ